MQVDRVGGKMRGWCNYLLFKVVAGSGKINQVIRAKIIPHITAAPTSECIELIEKGESQEADLLWSMRSALTRKPSNLQTSPMPPFDVV